MSTPSSLKRYLIALSSSQEEQNDKNGPLVEWIGVHQHTLAKNCSLWTSPDVFRQLQDDDKKTPLLEVETLWEDAGCNSVSDLLVASKILASSDDILGVVWIPPPDDTTALHNLVRACSFANIPLALNLASAQLLPKALFRRMAILIFNPAAGQRPPQQDMQEIQSILQSAFDLRVVYTEQDKDVSEQAKEILAWIQAKYGNTNSHDDNNNNNPTPAPILLASGGDGTVSAIAGATIDSGITVGIIPRGTANAFSVALGIPTDVQGACQTIVHGAKRQVDGATVSFNNTTTNDDESNTEISWINHGGLGFEAGLVGNTTRELKDTFGNFGYTIGAVQQVLNQKPFQCTFQLDDDPASQKSIQTTVVTISNVDAPSSIFAQGFGKVIPDDGLFEVTIAVIEHELDAIEGIVALAINTWIKDSVGSPKLLCLRCRKFQVSCSPAQKLLLDGEVLEVDERPVVFECKPKGLNVVVPMSDTTSSNTNESG
ncbi:Diacylglycerol kinase, catalytic region [Seminavis robusta]|uniref:Diacylglycerol kinase, catalytic region n=1 Tax=Seminavis robusta TaxID=568900 RepID=A0A9N8D525_9STRA|nr:Diacylglycerol kinase, catalytic region [Seminavis robusta]|eukprot:Sro6_g005190.1 Diacylglycerol kinase, catalytic region (486) ;mRNA; r:122118-123575